MSILDDFSSLPHIFPVLLVAQLCIKLGSENVKLRLSICKIARFYSFHLIKKARKRSVLCITEKILNFSQNS